MTDKYQMALERLKHMTPQTPGCAIGSMITGNYDEPYDGEYIGDVIKDALASCLPELPTGWDYYALENDGHDYGWVCYLVKESEELPSANGEGPTPRAAAQEAIKKIQGGGE